MIAILGLVVSSASKKRHGSCFTQGIVDGKDQPSIGIHSVHAVARTRCDPF